MEPPPVVLSMRVYRRRCVKQIRRALWSMPGVYGVSASRRTGMVVVRGDTRMDPGTLQRRLEHYMNRPVTVVSDGGRPQSSSHFQEIVPYAPPPVAYPYTYPPYAPQAAYLHYTTALPYYGYGYGYGYGYRHYPPSVLDDTVPGNTCTIL